MKDEMIQLLAVKKVRNIMIFSECPHNSNGTDTS